MVIGLCAVGRRGKLVLLQLSWLLFAPLAIRLHLHKAIARTPPLLILTSLRVSVAYVCPFKNWAAGAFSLASGIGSRRRPIV